MKANEASAYRSSFEGWARYQLAELERRLSKRSRHGRVGRLARAAGGLARELVVGAKSTVAGLSMFPQGDRFDVLAAAIRLAPSRGLWLEFGVWKGESINFIAQHQPAGAPIVFGFDSFEGLPEDWQNLGVLHLDRGYFSTGGSLPPVDAHVRLLKGWFEETLPAFLSGEPARGPVAFLHIDCDLYSSTRTVLSLLSEKITEGTVIVFDEFCLSPVGDDEARAWYEFCRDRQLVFRWIGNSRTGSAALVVIRVGDRRAQ